MLGEKFYKNDFNEAKYAAAAEWCNDNNYMIVDQGDYYEVVAIPAPEPETPAQIQARLTAAVQRYMDTTVQQRNYDSIHTAASYAGSTDTVFAAEGKAALEWRDKVWRKCYEILDAVNAGSQPIPTEAELLAMLPALEW